MSERMKKEKGVLVVAAGGFSGGFAGDEGWQRRREE